MLKMIAFLICCAAVLISVVALVIMVAIETSVYTKEKTALTELYKARTEEIKRNTPPPDVQ